MAYIFLFNTWKLAASVLDWVIGAVKLQNIIIHFKVKNLCTIHECAKEIQKILISELGPVRLLQVFYDMRWV